MEKFTKLEKGTFVKNGKEYDYVVEVADDFPKKKVGNVRLKIIEERPTIRKIRTRYDPDIQVYGDKNASMEIVLGYDMKEINKALKYFLFTLLSPFYLVGIFYSFHQMGQHSYKFIAAMDSLYADSCHCNFGNNAHKAVLQDKYEYACRISKGKG